MNLPVPRPRDKEGVGTRGVTVPVLTLVPFGALQVPRAKCPAANPTSTTAWAPSSAST